MVLVSAGETLEAVSEAQRAVALDRPTGATSFGLGTRPGARRGFARQNDARPYPDFAFSHFQTAMVDVARNDSQCRTILRDGSLVQDRQLGRRERIRRSAFTGSGRWSVSHRTMWRGRARVRDGKALADSIACTAGVHDARTIRPRDR